jgi:hypothetical protein
MTTVKDNIYGMNECTTFTEEELKQGKTYSAAYLEQKLKTIEEEDIRRKNAAIGHDSCVKNTHPTLPLRTEQGPLAQIIDTFITFTRVSSHDTLCKIESCCGNNNVGYDICRFLCDGSNGKSDFNIVRCDEFRIMLEKHFRRINVFNNYTFFVRVFGHTSSDTDYLTVIEKTCEDYPWCRLVDKIPHPILPIEDCPPPPPKWKKYTDKDGDAYYYNMISGLTQWTKPANFSD